MTGAFWLAEMINPNIKSARGFRLSWQRTHNFLVFVSLFSVGHCKDSILRIPHSQNRLPYSSKWLGMRENIMWEEECLRAFEIRGNEWETLIINKTIISYPYPPLPYPTIRSVLSDKKKTRKLQHLPAAMPSSHKETPSE